VQQLEHARARVHGDADDDALADAGDRILWKKRVQLCASGARVWAREGGRGTLGHAGRRVYHGTLVGGRCPGKWKACAVGQHV